MQRSIEIPEQLVYEEFDGHPVYRKGYRDYLAGTKTAEEIMGTSALQWFIIASLLRKILPMFPAEQYTLGTNEPGLHINRGTNLSSDIVIYRRDQLTITLDSVHYADVPPMMVIEVDVKADYDELFGSETSYIEKKTDKLLKFGVQKVVWITSGSQQIMVSSASGRKEVVKWDTSIELVDDKHVNVLQCLLENGLQA